MALGDFNKMVSQQYSKPQGIANARSRVAAINNKSAQDNPLIQIETSNTNQTGQFLANLAAENARAERDAKELNRINREKSIFNAANNATGVEPVSVTTSGSYTGNAGDNAGIDNGYYDTVGNIESRGNYNAYNKSGATGKYQFFQSTAAPYLAKHGKSWNDFKSDSNLQESIMRDFTNDNARGLAKAGIPVNRNTLWAAHNQGLGGARALYGSGNISTKNLVSNLPSGMAPTKDNYINYWASKLV